MHMENAPYKFITITITITITEDYCEKVRVLFKETTHCLALELLEAVPLNMESSALATS